MPRTIIHTATGEFRDEQGRALFEGHSQGWTAAGCPVSPDPGFSRIELPTDASEPDQRSQKWNGAVVVAKSAAEIVAYDAAQLSARALATSRQKDVLATCALSVRTRGIAAWNNMTTQQKITATLAEADVWKGIREFIDDKV